MASRRDARHRKNVTEERQEEARPEMSEDFAKLQIKPALEKYQDQRK
jgi:hypothetical protein